MRVQQHVLDLAAAIEGLPLDDTPEWVTETLIQEGIEVEKIVGFTVMPDAIHVFFNPPIH